MAQLKLSTTKNPHSNFAFSVIFGLCTLIVKQPIPGFEPFFESKSSFDNNVNLKMAAMTSFFADVRPSSNFTDLFVKYRPCVNFRAIHQKLSSVSR